MEKMFPNGRAPPTTSEQLSFRNSDLYHHYYYASLPTPPIPTPPHPSQGPRVGNSRSDKAFPDSPHLRAAAALRLPRPRLSLPCLHEGRDGRLGNPPHRPDERPHPSRFPGNTAGVKYVACKNCSWGKKRCPYYRGVLISGVSLERCPHFRDVLREVPSFQGCP